MVAANLSQELFQEEEAHVKDQDLCLYVGLFVFYVRELSENNLCYW